MINRGFSLKVHPKDTVSLTLLALKIQLGPINSLLSVCGYVLKCLNENCPQRGVFDACWDLFHCSKWDTHATQLSAVGALGAPAP